MLSFRETTHWYVSVLSDITPKGGEVDLVFSEKKNICKRLMTV